MPDGVTQADIDELRKKNPNLTLEQAYLWLSEYPERPKSPYSRKIRGKFEDWLQTAYTPEQVQSLSTADTWKINEDFYNQALDYYMKYIQGTPEETGGESFRRQPETFGLSATDLRLLKGMSDAGKERQLDSWYSTGKIDEYQLMGLLADWSRKKSRATEGFIYTGAFAAQQRWEAQQAEEREREAAGAIRRQEAEQRSLLEKAQEASDYAAKAARSEAYTRWQYAQSPTEIYRQRVSDARKKAGRAMYAAQRAAEAAGLREVPYSAYTKYTKPVTPWTQAVTPEYSRIFTQASMGLTGAEPWKDWFASQYPSMVAQFKTTIPPLEQQYWTGLTSQEAEKKVEQSWAEYLRRQTGEQEQKYQSQYPFGQNRKPWAYAPRIQTVAF